MPRPTNQTENALMSRGVDSHTAQQLRKNGWSLSKLRSSSNKTLTALGLVPEQITAIKDRRPPIPTDTLVNVLFENRFLCCICRNPERSIVIHHIDPWATSHDHSSTNLAVLCLHHHGEAHTTRELGISLTPAKLKAQKRKWESEVRKLDAVAIQSALRIDYDAWYFFNHLRIFELASEVGIPFKKLKNYQSALAKQLIDKAGMPLTESCGSTYMYSGSNGQLRYAYVKEVMDELLKILHITNISDHLDRGTLPHILVAGDFIFVQGAHTFSSAGSPKYGDSQPCSGKRSANHIEVIFMFNKWEATSMSAWSMWLSGRQAVGNIVQVKAVARVDGKLQVKGTVIGICARLEGLKERDYAVLSFGAYFIHQDEDESEFAEDNLE